MRPARAVLPALLLGLLFLPAAEAGWGGDLDPENGRHMLAESAKDLLPILAAKGAERADKIHRAVLRSGRAAIEAWKRFRNVDLLDLYLALLEHEDWHVRHRALLVLEHYWDASTFPKAWTLLTDPERRLREKAAITCIKLWDNSRRADDVEALLAREGDFYVRRCLEALLRRAQGTLSFERVHQEHVVTLQNGLRLVPFLDGMDHLAEVLPGYELEPKNEVGKGTAARLPAADRWVGPLLAWGEEEIPGAALQPFANLRENGAVYHVGEDGGACLDGAGFYAPAAGVVKLVSSGTDMGTVIAIEHSLGGGRVVTSLLMHGGDTVFVKPGDEVGAGQLLTSMGLSYSVENGGHFAHLHFALYPGAFDLAHTRGYQPVDQGLRDWIDPGEFLPSWITRTAPVVDLDRILLPALDGAVKLVRKDQIGRAWSEAEHVSATAGDPKVHDDAEWLLQRLAVAPGNAMRRARAWIDAGHPTEALDELARWMKQLEGVPDAPTIEEQLNAWKADESIQKALKGEPRVDAAEKKDAKLRDHAKMRKDWEKLRDEYGDTCLAPRIDAHLDR